MTISRRFRALATHLCAGAALLACTAAQAQPATHSISDATPCPCPSPCPPGVAAPVIPGGSGDGNTIPNPEDAEDLPEVADLSAESSLASAPQSAAPNAIGDTVSGAFVFDDGLGTTVSGLPEGGYRYRISTNNAMPQDRVYYNYYYFKNTYQVDTPNGASDLDLQRHLFGVEKTLLYGAASVGLQVPVHYQLSPNLNTLTDPTAQDTQIGNLAIYAKRILLQDCCKTISLGGTLNFPTADDTSATTGAGTFTLKNETYLLSPYLAALVSSPCSNAFMQGFVQVDIPLNDETVVINGINVGELGDTTWLHLDGSLGYWLSQDCCGNGIAALGELHYTKSIDGAGIEHQRHSITRGDLEMLNATVGAAVVDGCWSITPAIVVPLLGEPNRLFDWEAQVLVNVRY